MAAKRPDSVVLVDGDPIVYRTGFAHQQTVIHAVVECDHPVEAWASTVARIKFEGKKSRNDWLKEHPTCTVLSETPDLIVEPLSFTLQGVKQTLGLIAENTGSPDLRLFLSGSTNFRNALATIVPYKGNRDPANRPAQYKDIRDYLVGTHNARVVEGYEADDAISIAATNLRAQGQKVIVASIDKDLDQITGQHYDYGKHVSYDIFSDDADDWFWQQCLSGDPGDNVPGCYKIGPTRAVALVAEWRAEELSESDIWQRVIFAYAQSQTKTGCPYAEADAEAVALETAQLVYMQQKQCELWMPPLVPRGIIEGCSDY